MLKIRYYQATVWEVFKKRPADEVYVCPRLRQLRQFNNYELTMMTLRLKGKHLLVSRYRDSRFSILQLTLQLLYSQGALVCRDSVRSKIIRDMRKSQIALGKRWK